MSSIKTRFWHKFVSIMDYRYAFLMRCFVAETIAKLAKSTKAFIYKGYRACNIHAQSKAEYYNGISETMYRINQCYNDVV